MSTAYVTALRNFHAHSHNGDKPALTPPQQRAAVSCKRELLLTLQLWTAAARQRAAIGECGDKGGQGGRVLEAEAGAEGAGARAAGGEGVGTAAAKCGTWPETCWLVPHMPFSDRLSVLPFTHRLLPPPPPPQFLLCLFPPLPSPPGHTKTNVILPSIPPLLPTLPLPQAPHTPLPTPALQATRGRRFLVFAYSEEQLSNTRSHLVEAAHITCELTQRPWHHGCRRHMDVLVWVKTTYDRVDFSSLTETVAFHMLPYSRAWHAMAHRAMTRLPPPYIVVHYRSEFIAFHLGHKLLKMGFKMEAGVLEELMAWCMEAARDLIDRMKHRHNISAVFIAADAPFDDKAGSLVRSDSWRETTWMFQGRERVLQVLTEKLRWLREQVTGTVMVDELMPAINHYDPGQCTLLRWQAHSVSWERAGTL
ncbi:unnamed protein product [Closterium sp. NIES-53]